ncbi:Uncharacterised protein [Escherichia coli]|uniref:hypothetical protein n=1 Tax=Escherichia coli TaxID=562 RepID=UPI00191B52E4|nr:hypothetical protein [Escherichia coli]EEW6221707.1 hypothetical protein [Escherichia coli]EFN7176738.1 hypothetical protein [Escherichia coli]EJN3557347.1 hypothetical protein [Escherichia coli]EJN3614277.1 hypothetical protein [Escherichia coli]EJN3618880.1 hypothetical protein [Escherichia coli]
MKHPFIFLLILILVYSAASALAFILVVWLVSTHPLSMLEIVKYGELGILVGAWGGWHLVFILAKFQKK